MVIRTSGSYLDYSGSYTARIDGSGHLTVDYDFTFNGAEARVREIGLLFDAPATENILHWKHNTNGAITPMATSAVLKAARPSSATPPHGRRPSGASLPGRGA